MRQHYSYHASKMCASSTGSEEWTHSTRAASSQNQQDRLHVVGVSFYFEKSTCPDFSLMTTILGVQQHLLYRIHYLRSSCVHNSFCVTSVQKSSHCFIDRLQIYSCKLHVHHSCLHRLSCHVCLIRSLVAKWVQCFHLVFVLHMDRLRLEQRVKEAWNGLDEVGFLELSFFFCSCNCSHYKY